MSAYLADFGSALTSLIWVLAGVAALTIVAFMLDAHSTKDKW